MLSSDIAISVRGLSKSYTIAHNADKHTTAAEALIHRLKNPFQRSEKETFWALKNVEFDIRKGDVVGIIGRNGAGKSTLLKILSRITEPTTGQIALYGRVGSLLEVGTGFHPELTGRENIFLNGAILGMSKREITSQFDAIVDFAGIEQFIDTPVKRYSSGMYVRLAFAVAAHLNPEILIVDEVLAVGDSEFQKKCLGKMQDISRQEGRTVLFVSHNMTAVQSLCKICIHMAGGNLRQIGPGIKVIADYMRNQVNMSADVDLRERTDRPKECMPIVSRLQFVDPLNEISSSIFAGESLRLRLVLELPHVLVQPQIGIGVNNLAGQRMFTVHTHHSNSIENMLVGTTWIECEIPSLNLMPGRYTIKLAVGTSGKDLDIIEQAAAFEVLSNDVFGTGKIPDASQGVIFQHATWKLLCAEEKV